MTMGDVGRVSSLLIFSEISSFSPKTFGPREIEGSLVYGETPRMKIRNLSHMSFSRFETDICHESPREKDAARRGERYKSQRLKGKELHDGDGIPH